MVKVTLTLFLEEFLDSFKGIFFATGLLVLFIFVSDGGEMAASSLSLDPFFLANSSGWMLGKTPPAATVTPFNS